MFIISTFLFVGGIWLLISGMKNLIFCLISWDFSSFASEKLIIGVLLLLLGLGAYFLGEKIRDRKKSPEERERDRLLAQPGIKTCCGCGMNLKNLKKIGPNDVKYINGNLYCPVCAFNLKGNNTQGEDQ